MNCRHCGRTIVLDGDVWVDPEATGDDSIWRETCEAHDTFIAEHEPTDEFDDIVAGLGFEEVNTTDMNPLELNSAYNAIRAELLSLGEMLEAKTDRGRELHVKRADLVWAMREQGLRG